MAGSVGRTGATGRNPLQRAAESVDRLKTLILWTITLGALAAFLWLVVREVWTVRTVVEPIAVPEALRAQGYDSEVMSTALIDQIALISASTAARGERNGVAVGWGTADIVVPTLNISLSATAGLFENLLGWSDTRISGEILGEASDPQRFVLNLRVRTAREGWQVLGLPSNRAGAGWAPREPMRGLLEQPALALLLRIDPLTAASYLYVAEAERAHTAEQLLANYDRGAITHAIDRCLELCDARDRAAAYVLWANLLARVGEASADPELHGEALARMEQAAATGPLKSIDYTFWGDLLIAHGDEAGGFAKYDAAARAHPKDFLVPRNRAARLVALGRLDEALEQFAASAELGPNREWTLYAWGDALMRAGRAREAEQKFRAALLADTGIRPAYRGLAEALARQGRMAEAERYLTRAGLQAPAAGPAPLTPPPSPPPPPPPPAG